MFNIDRKTVLILLGAMVIMNVILGGRSIEGIIYALPGVIVAMTFHEFAHAWAATKLGDDTPKMQGRLSLNPLSHIDPVGLISLVLLGFRMGKTSWNKPKKFWWEIFFIQSRSHSCSSRSNYEFHISISIFDNIWNLWINSNYNYNNNKSNIKYHSINNFCKFRARSI